MKYLFNKLVCISVCMPLSGDQNYFCFNCNAVTGDISKHIITDCRHFFNVRESFWNQMIISDKFAIEVEVFLHNLSDEDLTCTALGSTTHPFENEIEHFQFLKICALYWGRSDSLQFKIIYR